MIELKKNPYKTCFKRVLQTCLCSYGAKQENLWLTKLSSSQFKIAILH